MGPKPIASASSATPAVSRRIEPSKLGRMSTPEERERESRESPRSAYERLLADESEERHEVAERLKDDPPPEPKEDSD
jgi:hypothetical protein